VGSQGAWLAREAQKARDSEFFLLARGSQFKSYLVQGKRRALDVTGLKDGRTGTDIVDGEAGQKYLLG